MPTLLHPELFSNLALPPSLQAMLAALGVIVAEATTGVTWQDAGKVELDGTSYLGLPLPFSVSQVCVSVGFGGWVGGVGGGRAGQGHPPPLFVHYGVLWLISR